MSDSRGSQEVESFLSAQASGQTLPGQELVFDPNAGILVVKNTSSPDDISASGITESGFFAEGAVRP